MEIKDITQQDKFTILFEAETKNKNGTIMNILVPFSQSDEKNKNGRIYPKALLQREINRVQDDINKGGFLGTADHPKSGSTELNSVSHIVNKMFMDSSGRGWAELGILDTTAGKNLKTIIKAGGRLGVSTRGFGTFNKETSMVKDDYKLVGLDIVSNPSFKDGVFSQDSIFESVSLTDSFDRRQKENIMDKTKKVTPKEVFWESRIAGISPKKMANIVNENNAKIAATKTRRKHLKEIRMACPEKSTEEIERLADKAIIQEVKSKIDHEMGILNEDEILAKEQEAKRETGGSDFLIAGATSDEVRRVNELLKASKVSPEDEEKKRKRTNLILMMNRTGRAGGFSTEQIEKAIKIELENAGLT